ncbi:MAG: helix-turn-helix domain-containing protein [Planctomycetales bacterium]|nr:helix-turn-helix domain-containing protein [Planctomycetales bacterium]NIP67699.1 helix-turn-helix domain-containing protein [Planctomycetales bacterium]
MAKKRITKRVSRDFSEEEKQQYQEIREQVIEEFPPVARSRKPSPPGIPSQIRAAREARGLTWYALAQRAGIPNSNTIRDIEQGRDVKLTNLQAVAKALDLSVELVELS